MCGIAGIFLSSRITDPNRLGAVRTMTALLRHRGPDGEGSWSDREAGIALGHRRLAILDLSEAGHQPMHSHRGRFVITFNGEVYNLGPLRRRLEGEGHRFQGHSDTELMLTAIEAWGLEAALRHFAGMFAFALWDRRTRRLHLVRDRIGKKPLYVAWAAGALVFASELKAIRAAPGFRPEVDPDAVAAMLARGWMPEEACIWRNAIKLPPGTVLTLEADELDRIRDVGGFRARIRTWWSLAEVARDGRDQPLVFGDAELVSRLDLLLRTAVGERMVADVSLGAFLSGGIDSSAVVAVMQAQSSRPVRTFTVGFGERGYDESTDAARVARHLGTEHTELRVTSADALATIPDLPGVWDEPFADESQIATLLVARLARESVTVALSGDGGDECFAGYARHLVPLRLGPLLALDPALRRGAAAALRRIGGVLREDGAIPLPARLRRALRGDAVARVASVLEAADQGEVYDRLTLLTPGPITLGGGPPPAEPAPPLGDLVSEMVYRDMSGYLPGDILVKVDRASMATGLEARCPLLDHRVVEFAWRLPTRAKIRHGRGKWILRQVLARYLPRPLFERPKQGFDVPVGAWLRGPLRDWAADLLSEQRLAQEGLLDAARVRLLWRQHASGERDHARLLWAVLMLEAWLDAARAGAPARAEPLSPELAGG